MNKCLCCHKDNEDSGKYHPECLKKLFGVSWIPLILINSRDFPLEVRKKVGKMSISGIQIKASVSLDKHNKSLSIVDEGGTHILKPEPGEYPELPQNENLCMNIAESLDIEIPPHGLFPMADGKLSYVIKRFDRTSKDGKIHIEDMAQILGLPPDSKYNSSLEKVGRTILENTQNKYLNAIDFFERVILCFILGNGDMHLKNWSLLTPDNNKIRLAPCYDLVCTELYLPDGDESALTINGKRSNLKKSDFQSLADYLEIDQKSVKNSFDKIIDNRLQIISIIDGAPDFKQKKEFKKIVLKHFNRIS